MSAHSIAKQHVDAALKASLAEGIVPGDQLHALLVTIVSAYKAARGIPDTRHALEFQANNLSDDIDYEFMRP